VDASVPKTTQEPKSPSSQSYDATERAPQLAFQPTYDKIDEDAFFFSRKDFREKEAFLSSGKEESVIQVALSIRDPSGSYSCCAGVAMTSLFSNTLSKVNVTVLHDVTLTQDNRRRFERTAERWRQTVRFIDVSEHVSRLSKGPEITTVSGALFRLLIPSLMDTPKVIYLDCDTVVNLDIADLWGVPLDASLAAVKGQALALRPRLKKIREWAISYDPENYFNPGVLVMNLSRIQTAYPSLLSDFSHFSKRYGFLTETTTQDFLNVFFRGDVLFLDKRFNNMLEYEHIGGSVLHLTDTSSRPWRTPRNTPRDRLFWETLANSEWGGALMDTLMELYDTKPLTSYRTLDCVKLLLQRLPRYFKIEACVNECFSLLKDLSIVLRERRCQAEDRRCISSKKGRELS
jgi:lipopolysaccharide biosynthesis glycosyltransferase